MALHSIVQQGMVQNWHSVVKHNTAPHSAAWHRTAQIGTAQHAQHSRVIGKHSPALHSAAQDRWTQTQQIDTRRRVLIQNVVFLIIIAVCASLGGKTWRQHGHRMGHSCISLKKPDRLFCCCSLLALPSSSSSLLLTRNTLCVRHRQHPWHKGLSFPVAGHLAFKLCKAPPLVSGLEANDLGAHPGWNRQRVGTASWVQRLFRTDTVCLTAKSTAQVSALLLHYCHTATLNTWLLIMTTTRRLLLLRNTL